MEFERRGDDEAVATGNVSMNHSKHALLLMEFPGRVGEEGGGRGGRGLTGGGYRRSHASHVGAWENLG